MIRTSGKKAMGVLGLVLVALGCAAQGYTESPTPSQAAQVIFPVDLADVAVPGEAESVAATAPDTVTVAAGPTIDQAGPHQYLVPTSGHVGGSAGTFWVTDMVVHNPGPTSASVNIYFLKEKQDNSATRGTTFPVAAGRSLKLKDVVEDIFGVSAASGALLIGSTVPVLVASRTFNDQPSGTFGQYVPAARVADLVSGTTPVRLVQLTKNAIYRTNIGIASMSASATPITVTLYRSSGALAGVYSEVVDAWGFKQFNDVFDKAHAGTADDAYAIVTSTLPAARYFAYASVIDGRTGDPITVIPVASTSAPAPAAVDAPDADTPDASTVTVFSDDFEGAYPSPYWTFSHVSGSTNYSVNWGRSSYRKAGGLYSWWCVGSGSTPAPGGNYPPGMGAWMQYGPFSLVGATAAAVELDLWLSKQTGHDVFGVWAATNASGSYSSVYVDPANTGGAFRHETVPLTSFIGAPQVWVAITFTSDASIQYEGAYVDNVVITKTVACAAPATPAVAAPASASSGAAYTVNWSATSPENRYEVQEADNAAFTGASTLAVSGTSRSFTHTVAAATTYYYRARALACSPTLQSAWSSAAQTVVSPACTAPAAPTLTAPATAASGASYTVTWTATSPSGTYEIDEATNSSFTGSSRATVSGTSRSYSHAVAGATTYYYRVRATVSCGGGLTSPWSGSDQTQVTPSGPSASAAVYVPGAAALGGSGGTNWRTDLEVHNPGAIQATYEIALLKRDQDNPNPLKATFPLEAGHSMRYGNVLTNLFGYSGAATLRVSPTAGQVMVTSRTYDDQTIKTYGQFVAGRPAAQAIEFGGAARLILLSQSSSLATGFRTNIGLVNVTGLTINVEVKVHYGDGAHIGTKQYPLGPYESIQVNEMIRTDLGVGDVDDAYAIVRTTTSGGAFFAYASVIDNRSKDPIYVPAEVVQ
ncbi:MAG: hypothetical protein MUF10_02710 [Thermoanaerobaculaceae bacterium]|nr:hypothetical protein [Thermoanaerobaculaceae bacterium]